MPSSITIPGQYRPLTAAIPAALQDVLATGRIARLVEELDADTLAAVERAELRAGHEHLDRLLEDWSS